MDQPINTPAPANPPAPAATPPPPPPPPPPVSTAMAEGGTTAKGIDWVGWILAAMAFTAFGMIIWKNYRQAKQSKKFADTQESLEARMTAMEKELAKKSTVGSLIPF